MPRYFFHVHDGVALPDQEGTDLSSLDEAKREAVELAGRHLIDGSKEFWKSEELLIDVATEDGVILFGLTFAASKTGAGVAQRSHISPRVP